MTRALVTGAAGFVGRYLVRHLQRHGRDVHGTMHGGERSDGLDCEIHACDVSDDAQVSALFDKVVPDEVYHLAAVTFVPEATRMPQKVMAVNLGGTLNVLEAAGKTCKALVVCSAEEYGAVPEEEQPIAEPTRLDPRNVYAVSKAAADLMAGQYAIHKGVHAVRVRPFNHTGPGQDSRFVCSDFARQIARMEAGRREPVLHVGNTDAVRDFSDVRDVVAAYRLLLDKGAPGEVYNVCSGTGWKIEAIVDELIGLGRVEVQVVRDPDRMRPSELPRSVGDNAKVRADAGWEPAIEFKQTLADILDYWREEAT